MIKRKSILLSFILFFAKSNFAQVFTVGNTCCNYNLMNKTFTVSYAFCTYPPVDFYAFDIDGDVTADIKISSFVNPVCFAGGASSRGITIASTTNCEFAYNNAYTCPNKYPLNLAFGTPLNSSLNWSICPTPTNMTMGGPGPYLYYEYINPSSFSYTCSVQVNPFYVGFRKILPSNDTIYGWIKMDTNMPGKLFDYAYTCGTYTGTPPASTITTMPATLCKGDSVSLNAAPSGGIFSGPGVTGNYFRSKDLPAGIYTVNYAIPNPNGCSTSSSAITFTVISASFSNTQVAICSGESLTLTASPPGGTFSGTYISGNVFSPTSTGTYAAAYTYTNSSGCNLTATVALTSNGCVGINEMFFQDNDLRIFPNPNVGEFEIKGTKESNIIITNELGQALKHINLNAANNYTARINDLQSGMYFIGNNSGMRKVIVIRD